MTEPVTVRPPGDKSISHRALLLAPLAAGTSRLRGLLDSADVRRTAAALRAVGAAVPAELGAEVGVEGPARFRDAGDPIDCGNSGTTARLFLGLAAGLGLEARLDGDASLRTRPMDRVVYPLQAMGARIDYEGRRGHLPVRLRARATGSLRTLRHRPKVASAQVKSCVLLAGLADRVAVEVREPGRSRDHTERLLRAMGAPIEFGPDGEGARAALEPRGWDGVLRPLDVRIPGDPSSAAFLGAAALLAGRGIRLEGVSLNPTRTGWLAVLRRMGVEVREEVRRREAGEPVGDLALEPAGLGAFEIGPAAVPGLLDEIPVLAVLAARAEGVSRLRGAAEARVKESDRLSLVARNLKRLGVRCREMPDGLEVEGRDGPLAGEVETGGDHRIAMAFAALGAEPGARIRVDDPGCVEVSFPGFWDALARVAGRDSAAPAAGPREAGG